MFTHESRRLTLNFIRFADPVFALFIGSTAAAVRVKREQKEKYPDQPNDWTSLAQKTERLGKGYWYGYDESGKTAT